MLSYVNGDLLTDRFRDYNDGAFPLCCRGSPRCAAASGRPGAAVAVPLQPAGDFEGVTSAGCARRGRGYRTTGSPRAAAARRSRSTAPRDSAYFAMHAEGLEDHSAEGRQRHPECVKAQTDLPRQPCLTRAAAASGRGAQCRGTAYAP